MSVRKVIDSSPGTLLTETAAGVDSGDVPLHVVRADEIAWSHRLWVSAQAVRHYRAVYRFASLLLRDGAAAEDVVQECFLRLCRQAPPPGKPRAWLLSVARNLCLDRLRRKGPIEFDSVLLEALPDNPVPEPAGGYDEARLEKLPAAVARLAEPQRSLIHLFYHEGLNGAECAAVTGLNPNQVKVYLHRARHALRQALEAVR